ncbi:hypothetical protein [Botrimarina sp.]|uniref:hypothetical protein n=1 Tax=Botrimarina sp. TaxID=2795802 RepID=UPI0032EC8DC1
MLLTQLRRSPLAGAAVLLLGASAWADSVVPLTFNGMIVNGTANNGFGSFTYNGADTSQSPGGGLSPLDAFVYDSANSSGGGLMNGSGAGYNAADNSQSPFDVLAGNHVFDIQADDFDILDRAGFGINFDPDKYKIEVVYKPLPTNEAPVLNVQFDTHDGFVIETRNEPPLITPGVGKRSGEQHQWGFGYGEQNIQQLYDSRAKDPDGFVTISTPLSDGMGGTGPDWTFTGPTFLFADGDQNFQALNTIQGEGAIDFNNFEGMAPNGVGQIHMQSAFTDDSDLLGRLHVEVKRISIVPINPDPELVARYDAYSGIGRRFGTPFTTQTDADGDGTLDDVINEDFQIIRPTDQLQRFDENGFTNLIIQTDDDDTVGGFGVWQEHQYQTFDGTQAQLVISAKLIDLSPNAQEANTRADSIGIVLNDIDGDDSGVGLGGEEYRYELQTADLNSTDFTEITVPLSELTRQAAFEFANDGDGSLEDFNLYYIGLVTNQDAGLVGLEIESIEVRQPGRTLPGDYNGDGAVNAADYTVWRDGGAPDSGQAGYNLWAMNYGLESAAFVAAGSAGAATPEPASGLLLAASLSMAVGAARRR